jgi:ADP-ribosylglycohydrolase
MSNYQASLMLASYFETIGFHNGKWEFNYQINIKNLNTYNEIWLTMLHHFMVVGGPNNIDITNWNASDDTIMIIATMKAVLDGGGEMNYTKQYLKIYDLLADGKRLSGKTTLETLKLLKRGLTIKDLPNKVTMGGNGAAMRTGPIGLFWKDDEEKIIEESIIASRLTHNYYIGYLGGMVAALFTSYAINEVNPIEWIDRLLLLYNKKIIHKYYPKNDQIDDLDNFMSYWKRYNELRIPKIKYKNSLDGFIYPNERTEFLLSFYPTEEIKQHVIKGQSLRKMEFVWDRIGSSGLDSCIYAYDCLLMSMHTPNSKTLDFDNIKYSVESFITLLTIHPGDNDTTAAIGGMWWGALNGYIGFDTNRLKQMEFYKELLEVSNKFF